MLWFNGLATVSQTPTHSNFVNRYTTKEAQIQWAENRVSGYPLPTLYFNTQKQKRKAKTNDVDSYVNDIACSPQAVTKLPPLRPFQNHHIILLSVSLSLSLSLSLCNGFSHSRHFLPVFPLLSSLLAS